MRIRKTEHGGRHSHSIRSKGKGFSESPLETVDNRPTETPYVDIAAFLQSHVPVHRDRTHTLDGREEQEIVHAPPNDP